jgi:hypothetical protein
MRKKLHVRKRVVGTGQPMSKPRLSIELIPTRQSNLNLRSTLLAEEWRELSKRIRNSANGQCQICGSKPDELDCHEAWKFSDKSRTQTLVSLMAICRLCHRAKHIGQQEWAGVNYDEAEMHLARVNGWTAKETREHVKREHAKHAARVNYFYDVDLSYVEQFGLTPLQNYSSTYLGSADDHEVPALAKRAFEESRNEWVAIYWARHGRGDPSFELGTVEPCTEKPKEIERLKSSFSKMRHIHGPLIGHYDASATEAGILADLNGWIERRDKRADAKPGRSSVTRRQK